MRRSSTTSLEPYDPCAVLCTEYVRVNLPLRTKLAFAEAARRRGISMSEILRAAAETEVNLASRVRRVGA